MAKKRGKAGTSRSAAAEKKRLFVEAMLTNGGNQTQAAIAAGYSKGSAAEKAGYRLSKDVQVRQLLEKRRAEVLAAAQEETELTAKEVLRSLARDLRFDPATMFGEDGNLLPLKDMPEETRMALRGAEVDEISLGRGENATVIGHTTKVKFPEKTAAREQAMKHFGLYERDNEQKPPPTVHIEGVKSVKFEPLRARK